QALLALAGAGAEAGVALDLLDVGVAQLHRVLNVSQRDVLAAAEGDLPRHAPGLLPLGRLGWVEHLLVDRLVEGHRGDPVDRRDGAELRVALERDLDPRDLAPLPDHRTKRHVAFGAGVRSRLRYLKVRPGVVAAAQRRPGLGRGDDALQVGAVGPRRGRGFQLREQLAGVQVHVPRRRDPHLLGLDAVEVTDAVRWIVGPRDLAVRPLADAPEAGHLHDRQRLVRARLEALAFPPHPIPCNVVSTL